jgi:hypothetical protein
MTIYSWGACIDGDKPIKYLINGEIVSKKEFKRMRLSILEPEKERLEVELKGVNIEIDYWDKHG